MLLGLEGATLLLSWGIMSNIVIGSGLAGMSLALLLAQQNQSVTLLEATPRPAPLMNGFTRKSLFFDTGFHYAGGLAPNGVLYRWLNALGVWKYIGDDALRFVTEEFRFAANEKYHFSSQESALHSTIFEQFQETESFKKFLSMMKDVLDTSPYMNPLQRNSADNIAETNTSLVDVLATMNLPEALKQMLMARCFLLGLPPQETSFKDYSVLSSPFFESSATVLGGGKKIRDAFLRALKDANITVQCNANVQSLLVEDKKIKGVRLANGKELSCERCFFTGHPQQLKSIVPPHVFRPAFFSRIEDMVETPYTFMIFGETTSDVLRNKVIYLLAQDGTDNDNTLEHDESTAYLSGGEPVNGRYPVVAIASIRHDAYTKGDVAYDAWKQAHTHTLVKYIEQRIPELAPIHILDAATPSTLRHWVYGSTGSLYGIAHSNDTLPLLPITRLEGFFLAGQNILLPGVLGAIVSAAVGAGFAFGHDEILQGFRK